MTAAHTDPTSSANPSGPGPAMQPMIILGAKVNRLEDEAQGILTYMANRMEKVVTKYEICDHLGWPQTGWRFGFRMARARRLASDQGRHLSFYIPPLSGYILTEKNAEVAINGVIP